MVPRPIQGLDLTRYPLCPFEAWLLSFVDGATPIATLAGVAAMSAVEMGMLVRSLVDRGVLTV